jgi:hypothetical protein
LLSVARKLGSFALCCILALLFCLAPPYASAQLSQAAQRGAASQARLEKEVRHVLVAQPFYTMFDNLAFQVNGDHVTLLGEVNPTLKSDAESGEVD